MRKHFGMLNTFKQIYNKLSYYCDYLWHKYKCNCEIQIATYNEGYFQLLFFFYNENTKHDERHILFDSRYDYYDDQTDYISQIKLITNTN